MQSHGNCLHIKTAKLLSPLPNTIQLTLDFRTGVVKNRNFMPMTFKIGYVPRKLPPYSSLLISQSYTLQVWPRKFLQKVKNLLLLIIVYLSVLRIKTEVYIRRSNKQATHRMILILAEGGRGAGGRGRYSQAIPGTFESAEWCAVSMQKKTLSDFFYKGKLFYFDIPFLYETFELLLFLLCVFKSLMAVYSSRNFSAN